MTPATYSSQASPAIGILLTNVGSPAAPTAQALRPYLAEFLGDPRIIELPRWLWLPILYGVILTTRPARSARLYRRIWTERGSPLILTMQSLAEGLAGLVEARLGQPCRVAIGMRYGLPSIASGLRQLRAAGAGRILVFPLFPQYSATTTATTFDAVFAELRQWRALPELRTLNDYHTHPDYIGALAAGIASHWRVHGQPARLLFSFHGIPKSYATRGDPYPEQCHKTAALLAGRLGLEAGQWQAAFQSRFGPVEWLKPYTDEVLAGWGREGLKGVHVVCPGFSADCLETVDEIGHEGRATFEAAGGQGFCYIPALNDRPDHLDALTAIALTALRGWDTPVQAVDWQPALEATHAAQ